MTFLRVDSIADMESGRSQSSSGQCAPFISSHARANASRRHHGDLPSKLLANSPADISNQFSLLSESTPSWSLGPPQNAGDSRQDKSPIHPVGSSDLVSPELTACCERSEPLASSLAPLPHVTTSLINLGDIEPLEQMLLEPPPVEQQSEKQSLERQPKECLAQQPQRCCYVRKRRET